MTQKDALTILKLGVNVFITGPAGSGKTHVVNEYIKYLKGHGVPVGITASTGIAATHMGGMTIHSWTGMGVRNYLDESDLAHIEERAGTRKRLEDVKVLIIDEVSMLHDFRFDMIDQILKHVKKNNLPFGGVQVVLSGDFFQLPPVSRMGEPEARFIYESRSWKEGKFAICYLEENHRQKNDISQSILNEIRGGEVSDETYELLKGRFRASNDETEPTRLYTHNIDVDAVNEQELAKLDQAEAVYEMSSRGRKPLVELLRKSCLAPSVLRLKEGARVMCVKNNFDKGYVNGTLGVVFSCGYDMDPIIKTAKGEKIKIERATWMIEEDGKILAEISQYPLRLAWAITVHKSQGMSLDALEVDLSKSFEPGMGYVALSRARTLAGLSILGMNEHALKVHPEVLVFDKYLQEQSRKAERYLHEKGREEIEKRESEFVAKAAPKDKQKKKKVSTVEKTHELIKEQKTVNEMANARALSPDTILGHLEELVMEGKVNTGEIGHLKYEVSPQHWAKIEQALEAVAAKQNDGKPPLLSPVKSKTGPNISFKEIRLARLLLGYMGKK